MRKGLLALVTAIVLSAVAVPVQALQCVPYARQISGIELQGDAWKWWNAAVGRYDRGRTPQVDAVMVFSRQGSMRYGHVSVVSKIVNSRMILVDHANWAPSRSAGRGEITKMVPVMDVSPKNDWSKVRVWYEPSSTFGSKIYRADGFVYNPTRRLGPTVKSTLHKVALGRETRALAVLNRTSADDLADGVITSLPVAAPAAAPTPVAAAAPVTAKVEAPKAAEPTQAPVVAVAAVVPAAPEKTHDVVAVASAPVAALPASVEINDNLGAAIKVARSSFGTQSPASGFMFN